MIGVGFNVYQRYIVTAIIAVRLGDDLLGFSSSLSRCLARSSSFLRQTLSSRVPGNDFFFFFLR